MQSSFTAHYESANWVLKTHFTDERMEFWWRLPNLQIVMQKSQGQIWNPDVSGFRVWSCTTFGTALLQRTVFKATGKMTRIWLSQGLAFLNPCQHFLKTVGQKPLSLELPGILVTNAYCWLLPVMCWLMFNSQPGAEGRWIRNIYQFPWYKYSPMANFKLPKPGQWTQSWSKT